jgi:hypothetical protein
MCTCVCARASHIAFAARGNPRPPGHDAAVHVQTLSSILEAAESSPRVNAARARFLEAAKVEETIKKLADRVSVKGRPAPTVRRPRRQSRARELALLRTLRMAMTMGCPLHRDRMRMQAQAYACSRLTRRRFCEQVLRVSGRWAGIFSNVNISQLEEYLEALRSFNLRCDADELKRLKDEKLPTLDHSRAQTALQFEQMDGIVTNITDVLAMRDLLEIVRRARRVAIAMAREECHAHLQIPYLMAEELAEAVTEALDGLPGLSKSDPRMPLGPNEKLPGSYIEPVWPRTPSSTQVLTIGSHAAHGDLQKAQTLGL